MTVLTEYSKAKKVTAAMLKLMTEYVESDNKADNACAGILMKACTSLPDYSKARLYDILTEQVGV